MIQLITYFFRHYIVCFLGALTRYVFDRMGYLIKKKPFSFTFSEYRDYNKKGDQEFIDAVIGTIILMITIGLIIPMVRKW